jgi:D-alanyl-D-alanine carboxypeptidase
MNIKRALCAGLTAAGLLAGTCLQPADLWAAGNTGTVQQPAQAPGSDQPAAPQDPGQTNTDQPSGGKADPAKPDRTPEIITASSPYSDGHRAMEGTTVIGGILLANKQHSLPAAYEPSNAAGAWQSMTLEPEAETAAQAFLAACNAQGNSMYVLSGYRSYACQRDLFAAYAARSGEEAANRYSSRPGQSDHQTGLAFDVGDGAHPGDNLEIRSENNPGTAWMLAHCAEYGFIVRFPEGKEDITGYQYEPWHYRYVGVAAAKEIQAHGWSLEEFLGDAASMGSADNGRRPALGRPANALSVDGSLQTVSTYNIEGSNYFRLRDLATLLEASGARFDLTYDQAARTIGVKTHTAYSGSPSLMNLEGTDIAAPNTMAITLDGDLVNPRSYNINGFTYYKLRDLGMLLGFSVDWDQTTRTMSVSTKGVTMMQLLSEPVRLADSK